VVNFLFESKILKEKSCEKNTKKSSLMKFRFLGDLDAPEWFLREITTLSRMTYVRIKLLVMHIAANICGAPLDFDKVFYLIFSNLIMFSFQVHLLVSTAEMSPSDIKASLATIRFALCKASQYNVDPCTFGDELTQLGLPNEHSMAIMRVFTANKEKLSEALKVATLTLPNAEILKWRVDAILASGGGVI
jgi:hypothetical protein